MEEFAGYFATDDQLWKFSRHLKERTFIQGLEIAAHTRSCFNVRYRTEPNTKKSGKRKNKNKKRICSEVSVNSLGNPWSQP